MKKSYFTIKRLLHRFHFYFMAAVFSVLFLSGCKGEKITPCYCERIMDWAPDTCSFSWTNYNSPRQVMDYFLLHDSTIVFHDGDTVKFWGWVYFHGPNEPIYEPYALKPLREDWNADAKLMLLVGNEDHHLHKGKYGAIWLQWDDTFLQENPRFVQGFDGLLLKKWYVTATINKERRSLYIGPSCDKENQWGVKYSLITIDTIPHNNKILVP